MPASCLMKVEALPAIQVFSAGKRRVKLCQNSIPTWLDLTSHVQVIGSLSGVTLLRLGWVAGLSEVRGKTHSSNWRRSDAREDFFPGPSKRCTKYECQKPAFSLVYLLAHPGWHVHFPIQSTPVYQGPLLQVLWPGGGTCIISYEIAAERLVHN
jgi:hypothetical protein